jgi:hypothetical protein
MPASGVNGLQIVMHTRDEITTGVNAFRITGVMLTEGDKVINFLTAGRDLIEEGNLCMRYYMKSGSGLFNGSDQNVRMPHSGTYSQNPVRFPVRMRAQPIDTYRDGVGTLDRISMDNSSSNVIANGLIPLFAAASVSESTWFIIPKNSGYSTIVVRLELDAEL